MTPDEYAHSIALAATEVHALEARVERLTDALAAGVNMVEIGDLSSKTRFHDLAREWIARAREVLGEVGE